MYPEPNRKMLFPLVKELYHPFVCVFRHTLKTGMFEPVAGSILGKRKFPEAVSGGVFV
jgi:hypothetical protein